jgi:hypothetical protein
LIYNVTASGTLGTPKVLTGGAPDLDFILVSGSTIQYLIDCKEFNWRRERDSFLFALKGMCKLLIFISARRAKNGRKANRGHNLGTVDWG